MFNRSDKRNIQVSDRFNKNSTASTSKTNFTRRTAPRKVLSSKSLQQSSDCKSCSTGVLEDDKPSIARPKKTTKSELTIKKSNKNFDFCKKCGDTPSKTMQKSDSKSIISNKTEPSQRKPIIVNERAKSVSQYYKNENFRRSSESVQEADNGTKKVFLDTIKELPERYSSDMNSKIAISDFDSYSDDEISFDTDDFKSIKKLKEFRNKNYFECHSTKSRINNKVSAINLKDHKCSYRFYLNDRLFPVPVSSDHQNNIRCVECKLPLYLKNNKEEQANGFIQAKIRIGEKEPQDTVMYLPVKDQLIIKERKKVDKKEEEVVYFGVIKIDQRGNSVFNENLPGNSLALKYQKGYKEFRELEPYRLKSMDMGDVVVI